jgi:hypothetical protein
VGDDESGESESFEASLSLPALDGDTGSECSRLGGGAIAPVLVRDLGSRANIELRAGEKGVCGQMRSMCSLLSLVSVKVIDSFGGVPQCFPSEHLPLESEAGRVGPVDTGRRVDETNGAESATVSVMIVGVAGLSGVTAVSDEVLVVYVLFSVPDEP